MSLECVVTDGVRICLLEDDILIAKLLSATFEQNAWSCDCFETIALLKAALCEAVYDLIVLDWSVPDGTAETLIPWIRERVGWKQPILVESVHGDEAQIVRALMLGADDYVVKPLRLAEVTARIQSLLRRTQWMPTPTLSRGHYRVDAARRELTLNGEPIALTRMELDLAIYLFQHAGELLSRERLLRDVWGIKASLETRTVDTHINRLRKKLKMDAGQAARITTLHGYGYRLEVRQTSSAST